MCDSVPGEEPAEPEVRLQWGGIYRFGDSLSPGSKTRSGSSVNITYFPSDRTFGTLSPLSVVGGMTGFSTG